VWSVNCRFTSPASRDNYYCLEALLKGAMNTRYELPIARLEIALVATASKTNDTRDKIAARSRCRRITMETENWLLSTPNKDDFSKIIHFTVAHKRKNLINQTSEI